jgi:hypothetical protein
MTASKEAKCAFEACGHYFGHDWLVGEGHEGGDGGARRGVGWVVGGLSN